MKHLIDIHVVLSTPEDMDHWDDRADEASDKLNIVLHMLYDMADEDIDPGQLEKMLQHAWENWLNDMHLLDIDDVDLRDWVDHLLSNWDDAGN